MKSILVLSVLLEMAGSGSLLMAQSPGMFTATGNMTSARGGHSATLLASGKVLIAGGLSPGFPAKVSASVELYDPATGTFTSAGNMTAPRGLHTATLLADGRVLIAGGWNGFQDLASAELYDPSTGTFTPTGDMITLRGVHEATPLPDGRVLVTGCANPCNSAEGMPLVLVPGAAIAELYDPATGRFADAGMHGAGGTRATLQADGRVLITGACTADFRGARAQLFDPATGTSSYTGLMADGCENISTATLLTNGQILFAGSESAGYIAGAELYDAVAGTFTSLGQMIGPHHLSAATLIPDGTVLVTGSQLPGGHGDPGAELYTPATGRFTLAGKMIAGRQNHTATLLPDGSVLIAGGHTVWPEATASAEIYRPSVLIPAPVLYSLSGDGRGQGAILHAGTARVVTATDPGVAGEVLEIYGTGLKDDSVIPPQVAIGGRRAEILYFGNAPELTGVNQVNVRIPSGVAPGSAVPVRLTYIGRPSNEVTIAVQ